MFAEFYARLRVSSAKGKSPASAPLKPRYARKVYCSQLAGALHVWVGFHSLIDDAANRKPDQERVELGQVHRGLSFCSSSFCSRRTEIR